MSYSRQSFGGRSPQHQYHPNPRPRGDGPAFSQQAGFFRPYPTNGSGPRNNVETGIPWHINRIRNINGGRWENGHQGQRRGPRPNNGQETYRPGNNNFYNGPAIDQRHQQLPRPNQNQSQGQGPFQQPKGRRRGGRNRRNNQSQQIPPDLSSPSSGSTEDSLLLSDVPEEQPQFRVPQFGIPPCGVDFDGDIEMTEAPPLESEIIRLLKEGTVALHNFAEIMLEYVKHPG